MSANNVNITSAECAWANFELKILGRTVKGLRGFEFKKAVEKEHIFGAGDQPLDIQSGNKTPSGNIKVLGFEADAMNRIAAAAGYGDITEVPHELIVIVCSFRKRLTDPISTYVATGVAFTENGVTLDQNAKHREITLPFLAMNISF